jgi:hypothetical protein
MTSTVGNTINFKLSIRAEDLVKVNWGKLAKGLFKCTHERVELREAEFKAPGRELA